MGKKINNSRVKRAVIEAALNGKDKDSLSKEFNVSRRTINRWLGHKNSNSCVQMCPETTIRDTESDTESDIDIGWDTETERRAKAYDIWCNTKTQTPDTYRSLVKRFGVTFAINGKDRNPDEYQLSDIEEKELLF